MTEDRYAHARQNAKAWAEEIIRLYKEWISDRETNEGKRTSEEIEDECREMPLSLLVRSGWYDPSHFPLKEDKQPSEYEILLSTGGPALRIIGDLDNGKPDSARLEIQDWGVPWQEANGTDIDYAELDTALLWFAGHFYYGE